MTPHVAARPDRDIRLLAERLSVVRCQSRVRDAVLAMRDIVGELTGARSGLREGEFYTLRDFDLTLHAGESVAVIGANGAGKSTLLKVLGGLLKPATGRVSVFGRVEVIIELGGGMDPLLTGRENCVLAAAARGFDRDRSRRFMDDVVEFGDLADAFDTVLATYSNGMQARLSFAIAATARPDLMLIDEALAVGDVAFQRRCVRFIHGFLEGGGALVLVSHNNFQVQSICERGILLERGVVLFAGSSTEAVRAMLDRERILKPLAKPDGQSQLHVSAMQRPGGGNLQTGEPAELELEYILDRDCSDVSWGFEIWTADEQTCVSGAQNMERMNLPAGKGSLRCRIDRLPLTDGRYVIKVNLTDLLAGAPIAVAGFDSAGAEIDVSMAPSVVSNYHVQRGQLTTMDVNWLPTDQTIRRTST